MTNFCRDCKWWKPPTSRVHTDYMAQHHPGWAVCERLDTFPDPNGLAVLGYEVDRVITAPNFGCVQWETNGFRVVANG